MFSFPSRHHPLPPSTPLTFTTSFQQPTGLHPKLDIAFPSQHLTPPKDDGFCALHAYLTLPSALFLDRYQLADPAVLAEHNLAALHSLSGEQDLEAPDWVVERWGSAALLELAAPPAPPNRSTLAGRQEKDEEHWAATVPLHLRYLQASATATSNASSDTVDLSVPYPAVFWACEASEGLKMATNPFDRVNLGYDGLFGPKTMFYHVPPAADVGRVAAVAGGLGLLEVGLQVPVLDPSWGPVVQWGTLGSVVLGFVWVGWGLLRGMAGGRKGGGGKEVVKKQQ